MRLLRQLSTVTCIAICSSCLSSTRIYDEVRKSYTYDEDKILGGTYVDENRKFVLNRIPQNILRRFDSLILIEKVVYLEQYYDCAVFYDHALQHYYRAKGLEDPKQVPVESYLDGGQKLSLYIFDKIEKGDLRSVIEEGRSASKFHPVSVFLTVVTKKEKSIAVAGYDLNVFTPREQRIRMDSVKRAIKERMKN